MGGAATDLGTCITVDENGNIYTVGYFGGTVDFDPNAGVYNLSATNTSSYESDIFIQKLDNQGNFVWAKSIGTSSWAEIIKSITLDKSGNLYIIGVFNGTVDFDPNASIYNLTSNGSNDFFIQKLDSNGNMLWTKSMGGSSSDGILSIAIDESNNIYTTGYFSDTVDFDPNVGVNNLIATPGNWNPSDIFIQKLDSNGNMLWAKGMGGNSYDCGLSIATDEFSNIYVSGYFSDTADFDPNTGVYSLISNGTEDIFVQKLDNAGNMLWTKSMGGDLYDRGTSINIDKSNNVCVTGYFSDTVDFDPNTGTYELMSNGSYDIFIQKLDANGNLIWAKDIGGASPDKGNDIMTDVMGNIYVTGCFSDTVNFGFDTTTTVLVSASPDSCDIFILKIDSTNLVGVTTLEKKIINIYPNPSLGLVNIDLDGIGNVSINIFTIDGKIVYQEKNINTTTHQLELKENPGIYIIEILTQKKNIYGKLIISPPY